MSLSVGIVNIDYLEQPPKPVSDFLANLSIEPHSGLGNDAEDSWGGDWTENALFECTQDGLMARARNWCDTQDIEPGGRTALMAWIADLPWRDGRVMLHIGA